MGAPTGGGAAGLECWCPREITQSARGPRTGRSAGSVSRFTVLGASPVGRRVRSAGARFVLPKPQSSSLRGRTQAALSDALAASAQRPYPPASAVATTSQLSLRPRRGQPDHIGRRASNCARMTSESLISVSVQWLPQGPGARGRRLELRSCLSLESAVPASLRWLHENQGQHRCQCGCGEAIRLRPRHYWRVPRYVHGHQNRRGHWRVLQLRQAGYLTVSDVARVLGIGVTTLRRWEGARYPAAVRIGNVRTYRVQDIEQFARERQASGPGSAGPVSSGPVDPV